MARNQAVGRWVFDPDLLSPPLLPFARAWLMDRTLDQAAPEWLDAALGPCRIWQGNRMAGGNNVFGGGTYPRIRLGRGRDAPQEYVHRLAFVAWNGRAIADGMTIDHMCCVRRCIADRHLQECEQAENVRLMFARRRSR